MTKEESEKALIREQQEKAWIKLGENLADDARIVGEGATGEKVDTEEMLHRIHKHLPHDLDRAFMAPVSAYHRMYNPSPETALIEHLEGVERELALLEAEHQDFNKKSHVLIMLNQTGRKLIESYETGTQKMRGGT